MQRLLGLTLAIAGAIIFAGGKKHAKNKLTDGTETATNPDNQTGASSVPKGKNDESQKSSSDSSNSGGANPDDLDATDQTE